MCVVFFLSHDQGLLQQSCSSTASESHGNLMENTPLGLISRDSGRVLDSSQAYQTPGSSLGAPLAPATPSQYPALQAGSCRALLQLSTSFHTSYKVQGVNWLVCLSQIPLSGIAVMCNTGLSTGTSLSIYFPFPLYQLPQIQSRSFTTQLRWGIL